MSEKDEQGRWVIPPYTGLPTLILMESGARGAICGYRSNEDCLSEFTATELLRFKDEAWVDSWEFQPSLRCWRFDGKAIYGMFGWPKQVAAMIRRIVCTRGVRRPEIYIPKRDANEQTFYIVGACRLRKQDDVEDLMGREIR